MKSGKEVRFFLARDGRKIVLRTPRWEDLDDLLDLINSLVAERANIIRDKKVSREEEIDWLSGVIRRQEKDEVFFLVAEVDGRVVASSEISRRLGGYDAHVGAIGIAIKNGFRNVGIGTELMMALIEQGRVMGLKVLTLCAFEGNASAIHVYEKVGFEETGRIPRKFLKEDKYLDEVIMTKFLE